MPQWQGRHSPACVLAEQPGPHLHHPRGGPERGPGERDWEPAHVHHPPGWGLTGGSWGHMLSTHSQGPPGAPGPCARGPRCSESRASGAGRVLVLPAATCASPVPPGSLPGSFRFSVLGPLGVPVWMLVSACPSVPCLVPYVWVRLTVSLCLSVLCSWTLSRTEWYGFFVSSALPGPTLPQVRGPEFSLQLCSGRRPGKAFPS